MSLKMVNAQASHIAWDLIVKLQLKNSTITNLPKTLNDIHSQFNATSADLELSGINKPIDISIQRINISVLRIWSPRMWRRTRRRSVVSSHWHPSLSNLTSPSSSLLLSIASTRFFYLSVSEFTASNSQIVLWFLLIHFFSSTTVQYLISASSCFFNYDKF